MPTLYIAAYRYFQLKATHETTEQQPHIECHGSIVQRRFLLITQYCFLTSTARLHLGVQHFVASRHQGQCRAGSSGTSFGRQSCSNSDRSPAAPGSDPERTLKMTFAFISAPLGLKGTERIPCFARLAGLSGLAW